MSASAVRTQIRTWAAEIATSEAVPYYDTVNIMESPTEAVWWTIEFRTDFMEGTFCKAGYIEEGYIRIDVVAAPGTGDAAAIAAMEKIVPAFDAKLDPTQRVVLTTYEPIQENSGGSADKSYRVSVVFNYRHSL